MGFLPIKAAQKPGQVTTLGVNRFFTHQFDRNPRAERVRCWFTGQILSEEMAARHPRQALPAPTRHMVVL
jgi:hypothetical protein